MSQKMFSTLNISTEQLDNLQALGYQEMTVVQQQSLPHVLEGRDVIAQAKTGSGKTAAFGIGLLEQLDASSFDVQTLVLCPTRELADQVATELRKLARCFANIKIVLLSGGKPMRIQVATLEYGAHIIVGTPGRVLDHLSKSSLQLDNLKTFVLDEADRMLDTGFYDAITDIVSFMPKTRQTLLFSATFDENIRKISQRIQCEPVNVEVAEEELQNNNIEQIFYKLKSQTDEHRDDALLAIFEHYQPESALVFCQTKKDCAQLAKFLTNNKIQALAIHGDLEQREREQVLLQFSNHSCAVLVATDVAARGLDIKELPLVINYQLPPNVDTYVHRIGRTGRAESSGVALNLFAEYEQFRVDNLKQELQQDIKVVGVDQLKRSRKYYLTAPMCSIQINLGRKSKIRPGDILGALTSDKKISSSDIGKIDIFDMSSYVAVTQENARAAMEHLQHKKIKGKNAKAKIIYQ